MRLITLLLVLSILSCTDKKKVLLNNGVKILAIDRHGLYEPSDSVTVSYSYHFDKYYIIDFRKKDEISTICDTIDGKEKCATISYYNGVIIK